VKLIRAALTGAPVSHHGPTWNVEAGLSFTTSRPDPPIDVANTSTSTATACRELAGLA
jgi:hypothetical protein